MKDPLDPSGIKTVSIKDRKAKVSQSAFSGRVRSGMSVKELLDAMPGVLAAGDLLQVARAVAGAAEKKRPVILGMGGHVIKVGLSPLVIGMMESGAVTGLCMNGSCIIHDYEIALTGNTSEDVAASLDAGMFGMTRETAEGLNSAVARCGKEDISMGRAVGEAVLEGDFTHKDLSLLAAAARLGLPATVHVAIGTDIIHMHPSMDPAATGKGSHRDFLTLAAMVADLQDGVYINLGSAVILPEVFLKALSLARNLGHKVNRFTAVNMDFIQHYRPGENVVKRPVQGGGQGYRITGHHEIMLPLLAAAIEEYRALVRGED